MMIEAMTNHREAAAHALVDLVQDDLTEHLVKEIRSLIDAGEPGVALEILVDNVLEDDLPVPPAFRGGALQMAADMKLIGTNSRWNDLAATSE